MSADSGGPRVSGLFEERLDANGYSPLALTADATSYLGEMVVMSGSSVVVSQDGVVQLNALVSGGTSYHTIAWTGPGGFASDQAHPDPFVPPERGVNLYEVTVSDWFTGEVVSGEVTVVLADSPGPNALWVGHGGVKYKATLAGASSVSGQASGFLKMRLLGLDLRTGDTLSFVFNGVRLGMPDGEGTLTLDHRDRARGQMFGPAAFFDQCRISYKAKRRMLKAVCRRGSWSRPQGVVSATSVRGHPVPLAVLIDDAPPDGITDRLVMATASMDIKVRRKKNTAAVGKEIGTARARR